MGMQNMSIESTVLVVDDDPQICVMIKRLLERHGISTIVANDGFECEVMIDYENPKLIILDLHMPNRNGIDTLKIIRQKHPLMPVIVVTGGGQKSETLNLANAKKHGANILFTKPFEHDLFVASVQSCLQASN